jgi:hypothetical protein
MSLTTILKPSRSTLEIAQSVMALDWERDADTRDGYVAAIPNAGTSEAVAAVDAMTQAGLEASWSSDDDGRYFVWVCPAAR